MTEYSDNFKALAADFFTFDAKGSAQIIVYSPSVTKRLIYTCDFILKQGLQINYDITSDQEAFKKSSLLRVNYSDLKVDGAIHILPSGLLSETEVRNFRPKEEKKNGNVYFFSSPDADFHFDIFSAVFYFISRYEEHLPYTKDIHGRFEIKASLLYAVGFHRSPVVDKWIKEFRSLLQEKSTLNFPQRKFRYLSTIDVDNVFAFKTKPFGRMAGANLRDFMMLNFSNITQRFQTRYFKKEDPFDAYDLQINISEKNMVPLIYFFLCRNNTAYDRTVDVDHPMVVELLRKMGSHGVPVGIHPSYFSSEDKNLLATEVERLGANSSQSIKHSRQHFLRFDIKTTPKELLEQGIKYDFTMGFSSDCGYRAGTTLPFYYYDFEKEEALALLAIPFIIMDGAYYLYKNMSAPDAEKEIFKLAEEARSVDGLFVTVFHDRTFWEQQFPGWKQLYVKLQEKLGSRQWQ